MGMTFNSRNEGVNDRWPSFDCPIASISKGCVIYMYIVMCVMVNWTIFSSHRIRLKSNNIEFGEKYEYVRTFVPMITINIIINLHVIRQGCVALSRQSLQLPSFFAVIIIIISHQYKPQWIIFLLLFRYFIDVNQQYNWEIQRHIYIYYVEIRTLRETYIRIYT